MFPSAKIQGYLYQFLQISKWFRNFQTIAVAIRKQSSGAGGSQTIQIQPWTKILGMFNTQTNNTGLPDVRAHHMLFETFR